MYTYIPVASIFREASSQLSRVRARIRTKSRYYMLRRNDTFNRIRVCCWAIGVGEEMELEAEPRVR